MTRRLLLLRHGKAESPLGVSDQDRPLAGRGRRQSEYAGAECRARGVTPELVVVSPARRAWETWEWFAAGLKAAPEVDIDRRVYANTVDDLLDVINEVPDEIGTLLIVGHNPSVAGLASILDDDSSRPARTPLADGYPTGALAVFDLDVSWALVAPGVARLREVIRRPH
ncbi:SixA phosphatase family protein [Actinopolymorpha alba]|uniref:SixA phosphatase family protein n=1 Tax=Actinopolymorpha alba TaxID=533267 RepID=UPI000477BCA4|nr:histidine phosphatase family protein [Actinopolymorpha alba]